MGVGSQIFILNCLFDSNSGTSSSTSMGAVYLNYCRTHIENCTFSNNSAKYGAAVGYQRIQVSGQTIIESKIVNSLFYNNTTTLHGGVVFGYDYSDTIFIINNTFAKNSHTAPSGFKGSILSNGVGFHLRNNIIWDDTPLAESNGDALKYSGSNNILKGSILSGSNITNSTTTYPTFTDSTNNDFTIQSGSLSINSGDTTGISYLIPATDLNGNVRIEENLIDLGCYEACSVIDITSSSTISTITVAQSEVSYQWLDCNNNNAIIPNETSQSFTPTSSGSYACEISNGCNVDTSFCTIVTVVGIEEQATQSSLTTYPNPATSKITITNIQTPITSIIVLDVTGKTVLVLNTNSHEVDVSSLNHGIYFLQIQTNEIVFNSRFIKE
jgi:hypothetical protein